MTIAQLKYVLEISKTRSINKAAQNLFISHSVISIAIKNLESELGNEIFIRTPKGVKATPFGSRIIAYLKPLQIQLEQLNSFFEESKECKARFSVASTGFPCVTQLCSRLIETYNWPSFYIQQYEEFDSDIPSLVADQVAEIGVYRTWSCYISAEKQRFRARNIEFYSLANLDIGITVGQKNPLFYQKEDWVLPGDLAEFPAIIYLAQDLGPYSDIFRRLGLFANRRIATTSRSAIFEYLTDTNGYYLNSIYPQQNMGSYPKTAKQRRTLHLVNCEIQSVIGWLKHRDYVMSDFAKEFVAGLEGYFD